MAFGSAGWLVTLANWSRGMLGPFLTSFRLVLFAFGHDVDIGVSEGSTGETGGLQKGPKSGFK
jgi:hypothetical protein